MRCKFAAHDDCLASLISQPAGPVVQCNAHAIRNDYQSGLIDYQLDSRAVTTSKCLEDVIG